MERHYNYPYEFAHVLGYVGAPNENDWTSFYFADVAGTMGRVGLDYVGSLPVHTNFWDLCVLPEFQELFRTTSNRLVTEAHKDFCANTAFRWDLYARQPTPLATVEERLARADDLCFGLSHPDQRLPHTANLGIVTSTTTGVLYETLLDTLRAGSRPLSAIVADRALAGVAPTAVAQAVDAGVATGLFEVTNHPLPAAAPVPDIPLKVVLPFNRAVLATDMLAGRPIALASTLSGTATPISDLDAAFVHELTHGGRAGLVERMDRRLVESGRGIERERRPVTDPAERTELLSQAADAVCTTLVPQLVRKGILAAAE